jgi:hypothetical protein
MNKKVKTFALIVLAIAAALGGYMVFGGAQKVTPAATGTPLTSSAAAGGAAAGASANEFTSLLSNVNSITIDTSIFTNPAYKMLRDYPVDLGTDTVGRANPFAPVGTDVSVAQVTLEAQTLAPGKITATSAEFGVLVTLPDTVPIAVVFQYGTSDAFGSTSTPISMTKSGTGLTTVTGLRPGTTYKVQAVAVRGSSTTNANTVTFTTLAR